MRFLNILLPVVLLGCAIAMSIFGAYSFAEVMRDEDMPLATPGSTTVKIEKPGEYNLWSHVRSVKHGVVRTFPKEIPNGIKISIVSLRDGGSVPWEDDSGMNDATSEYSRVSFGLVKFLEPGLYTIEISGVPEEGRAFSIEDSKFPQPFFNAMLGLLGGFCIGLGAGIWLGVVLIVRLARRRASSVPPPM